MRLVAALNAKPARRCAADIAAPIRAAKAGPAARRSFRRYAARVGTTATKRSPDAASWLRICLIPRTRDSSHDVQTTRPVRTRSATAPVRRGRADAGVSRRSAGGARRAAADSRRGESRHHAAVDARQDRRSIARCFRRWRVGCRSTRPISCGSISRPNSPGWTRPERRRFPYIAALIRATRGSSVAHRGHSGREPAGRANPESSAAGRALRQAARFPGSLAAGAARAPE